jgi:aspartyl/asparaginyl beta-hydroxylase (cupin superfamily)
VSVVGVAVVPRLVTANNRLVRWRDGDAPNPRPIAGEPWYDDVRAAHPAIRAEWERFVDGGGRLPLIDDLLAGPQGNVGGWWRAGVLIARRRPRPPLADLFPTAVRALLGVPDLLSAMVSVLGPGAELPAHTGDNAGALNFLLGVVTPPGAGHSIEDQPVDLDEGELVVFDDTLLHAAWNRSDEPRVLIIGDILRPMPAVSGRVNAVAQLARHRLTPAYSRSCRTGAELHVSLNG